MDHLNITPAVVDPMQSEYEFGQLLEAVKCDDVMALENEIDRLGIEKIIGFSDVFTGETLAHIAAANNSKNALIFLEAKGLDCHQLNEDCENAVHSAVRSKSLAMVQCLNERGLSLDIQNKRGESPIHIAAQHNCIPLMEFLCTAGANINMRDKALNTPLHLACMNGLHKIVMVLCAANALTDVQNKSGMTPLMCASVVGSVDCVRQLLSAKSRVNIEDRRGWTALEHAIHSHQATIALMLINYGARVNHVDQNRDTCLHLACREGLLPVVQALCAYGCTVDIFNGGGVTPLQMVARKGDLEIVRCLLLAGANPQLANKKKIYPDVMALAQGHAAVASLISRMKPERRAICVEQLVPTTRPLPRVKIKIFGHSMSGKTSLIDSLQSNYITGYLKKKFRSVDYSCASDGMGFTLRERKMASAISYELQHDNYTRGIQIQNIKINGVGELSVWEFSGYEPYYMTYDHFIGDANCIHMILFSLADPMELIRSKVFFWLQFLKVRLPAREPLGYCGKPRVLPKVILVATHADQVLGSRTPNDKNRSSSTLWFSPEADAILQEAKEVYLYTIELYNEVIIVDCNDPLSSEMKELKTALSTWREELLQKLPKANGFLDVVSARIVDWTENSEFPVVTWQQFVEQVRSRVNPLSSEDHLKDLVQQLQYTGEIVYVESEEVQDLIVLRPQWLCEDVIGSLFSYENICNARITGSFTIDDIHFMIASRDTHELLKLLTALDLCTACPVDDEIQYEFPGLVFVEHEPDPTWCSVMEESQGGNHHNNQNERVACAWQLRSTRSQLVHIYPRLTCRLRKSVTYDPEIDQELAAVEDEVERSMNVNNANNSQQILDKKLSRSSSTNSNKLSVKELHLIQWFHGARIFTIPEDCGRDIMCQITLEEEDQVIEIKCVSHRDNTGILFGLFQDMLHLIAQVMDEMCPCLEHEIFVIEPTDLFSTNANQRNFTMIPQGVLFRELLHIKEAGSGGGGGGGDLQVSQNKIDNLLFFSDSSLRERVSLGPELHISSLRSPTFQKLCFLLDPPDEMGRDWCLLAIKLGMQQHVPQFDNTNEWLRSRTARILDEWGREAGSSIGHLAIALTQISRHDAAECVINASPLFSLSVLENEEESTIEIVSTKRYPLSPRLLKRQTDRLIISGQLIMNNIDPLTSTASGASSADKSKDRFQSHSLYPVVENKGTDKVGTIATNKERLNV